MSTNQQSKSSSTSQPKIDEKFANWIMANRPLVIILCLIVVAVSAYSLQYLSVSSNNRIFFGPENPQLIAFDEVEENFQRTNNILFIVEVKEGKVFSQGIMNALEELTSEAWEIPHVYRVDSISNYQYSKARGDDLDVGGLIEFLEDDTPESYNAIESIALNDEFIAERLISLDGKIAGVSVLLEYPEGSTVAVLDSVKVARQISDQFEQRFPQLDIRLTGTEMISATFAETSLADAETLIPAMYIVIVVLLILLLRSVAAVIVTAITAGLTVASALGIAAFTGVTLTPMSISAPTVILTIVVAHSVHVLVTYFQQLRQGKRREDAMRESLRVNAQPVFLTSLTTLIGFLSLNVSDTPPIQDFGNIVGLGVCYGFVLSLCLLPAMMSYMPVKIRHVTSEDTRTFMDTLADFVIRHKNLLFWSFLFAGLFFTAFSPTNVINDQYSKYFDESMEFRKASDFADKSLAGLYSIEYILDSGVEDGITDPEYLASINKFAEWLRAQPDVRHVAVFSDVMKRLNKNMHGDDPTFHTIPETKELASQYLLLFEMSLPAELDLSTMINSSRSATRLSVSLAAQKNQSFYRA